MTKARKARKGQRPQLSKQEQKALIAQQSLLTEGPAYQKGDGLPLVIFILSAPGRYEKLAGHPAAARSGDNLNDLIGELHQRRPDLFPYPDKTYYGIVNVWPEVEYLEETRRSEATPAEVRQPHIVNRLARAIQPYPVAIALGNKAREGLDRVDEDAYTGHRVTTRHPAQRGINHFKTAHTDKDLAHRDRIRQWADDILGQLPPAPATPAGAAGASRARASTAAPAAPRST